MSASETPSAWPPHLSPLVDLTGKNQAMERRLWRLNEELAAKGSELESRFSKPEHPPVFIFGPPRSGTTLSSQLLAATGLFGMVSNLAARFWRAPALGLMISQALGLGELNGQSDYESRRGLTKGWGEPNEFGYFWSRFFDLGQATHALGDAERARFDRNGLRRAVASMEAEAGRPMAFKNNTWFSFQADLLAEIFPGAILVVCRRDPFYAAQSLYLQRLDLYGDEKRWWSMRPPEYEEIRTLPPIEQVARQAVCISRHMEESLTRASGAAIVDASYNRLAADPQGIIREIAAAARAPLKEETLAQLPRQFESTDRIRLEARLASQLRTAIAAAQEAEE